MNAWVMMPASARANTEDAVKIIAESGSIAWAAGEGEVEAAMVDD